MAGLKFVRNIGNCLRFANVLFQWEKTPYEMTVLENFIFLRKVGEPAAIDA